MTHDSKMPPVDMDEEAQVSRTWEMCGLTITATDLNRVMVNGVELCNDEPLRVAQTLIQARIWAQTLADTVPRRGHGTVL
jgi:hypothetical protein